MPNLLLDLEVDRVDLVDEGANSEAFIRLYKRKEQENNMELKDILAKMKPEHVTVIEAELAKAKEEVPEAISTDLAKAKDRVSELEADLAKAKQDLESVSKSKDTTEDNVEDVIKSLDPAVQEVFKSLKAQKEQAEEIAKAAAVKALNEEAIAKAKELKSIPVEEAKLVEVVKGVTPELFEVLKAANAAIEGSGVLEEVGKGKPTTEVTDSNSAWEAIEKAAREIAEAESMSIEKATGEVLKRKPELYRTYLKGGN